MYNRDYVDGLVQNCSISIANALEILQSCTKPWFVEFKTWIDNYIYINYGM